MINSIKKYDYLSFIQFLIQLNSIKVCYYNIISQKVIEFTQYISKILFYRIENLIIGLKYLKIIYDKFSII